MKQIIKFDMRLITIILTLLQFKIDIGESYNNNDGQSNFWGHVNSNNNHDVVQQNFQTKKQRHNHHHQESKDYGNSIGRWAQQPGRGCFWTGCMSKLHQHYCPAATFAHEVNPCPSPALHVDVMCCLSRPQEATQPKIFYMAYPTITSTTTTETPTSTTTTTVTTTTTTPPTTGTSTRHHNHHQSKGHGNSFGRWAQQPGRGCFWTGCMSKFHQHYCPAATFVHEINLCPSPALHVDVMCCLSRPQEATQSKAFDVYVPPTTSTTEAPPPTITTTTTVKTTTSTPPTITTETPPTITTTKPSTTTNAETLPTTTAELPTTTNTETPPTTTAELPTTTSTETPPTATGTTDTPPTTTTGSASSEVPPTTSVYDYVIEVTSKVHRK